MNLKTFTKNYRTLSSELYRNPHRSEILDIMQKQILDDNLVIEQELLDVT